MNKFKKIVLFIIAFVIIAFINMALQIYENKNGIKFFRTLTFILPLMIIYFVIFKFQNNNKSENSEDGNS
jgi:hypothetical protein